MYTSGNHLYKKTKHTETILGSLIFINWSNAIANNDKNANNSN